MTDRGRMAWPLVVGLIGCGALPAVGGTIAVRGDDEASLIAAIEASRPGDTVEIPGRTFLMTRALRPRSSTRILGAGAGRTVLRFAGDRPSSLVDLHDRQDVELAAMTLDGAGNVNVWQGVSASNARLLNLHDLTIREIPKGSEYGPHAILFTGEGPERVRGVTDSAIVDCSIETIGEDAEFGAGIRLAWGSSRIRILRNTIRNTGRGGIFGNDGSTDLVIRHNTVGGSGGEGLGIEVWNDCDRATIEDNRIDHWLSVDGSDRVAVRRNTIADRSGKFKLAGLELVGSNDCVLTDNLVDGGQNVGISVSNKAPKDFIYWADNTIRGCNQWGAQLQGEDGGIASHYFYRCKFVGNRVGKSKPPYPRDAGHGFRFNGHARRVTFEECEFRNNEGTGIQVGGDAVDALTFVRCTIADNGGPAMTGADRLSALDLIGCKAAGNEDNTLPAGRPSPGPPPVASFRAPGAAIAGRPVAFVDTSQAAEGTIRRVLWDFQDGIPSTDRTASHTFAEPGEYRVTLVAWDESGRGARAERRLEVSAGNR